MPENEDPTTPGNPTDDPIPLLDSHTPIIITDGSAALEFTESAYERVPDTNSHTAIEHLHLVRIISDRPHTENEEDFQCFASVEGESYEIEVKCAGGGGFNDFTIRGSLNPDPPVEVVFDRGEYKESANFPPRNPNTAKRFGTHGREITKFRVFKVVNGQRQHPAVHDCRLVTVSGNGWTIHDDHVAHEDDNPDVVNNSEEVQPQPV